MFLYRLWHTRLAFRTAVSVLALALAVGVLFAALAYQSMLQQEREDAHQRMTTLFATVESTLAVACYLGDTNLAQEVSRGLLKNEDVRRVRVQSAGRTLAEQGRPPAADASLARMPAAAHFRAPLFSPFNARERVCEIDLESDTSHLQAKSVERASKLSGVLLVQALGMAVLLGLAVLHYIVHPISQVSHNLHTLSAESGELLGAVESNRHDEVGRLVKDVNVLISRLAHTIDEERTLRLAHARGEQRLEMIFKNAETGLFQIDPHAQLLTCNPAFLRMLSLSADEGALAPRLLRALEGQQLRLHLMIDEAIKTQHTQAEDFCLNLGWPPQKRWLSLILTPIDAGCLQGLLNDVTERKQREEAADLLASTDPLTGMLNRLGLQRALHRQREASVHAPFFLLLIDLDGFKAVNDQFGHDAGDAVLKGVAMTLQGVLRKSDIVARLGGDEFVVILHSLSDPAIAATLARKMLDGLATPFVLPDGQKAQLGASIGIAQADSPNRSGEEIIREADQAMYQIKRSGKNAYAFFSSPRAQSD